MANLSEDDKAEIRRDFEDAVNMTPKQLEDWLGTDESQEVGWGKGGGGESIGHESGRRIVAIKRTKQADLDDDDYEHMREVVGYVRRHIKQGGPKDDKEHSRWRYSLMNWGHDPLKS